MWLVKSSAVRYSTEAWGAVGRKQLPIAWDEMAFPQTGAGGEEQDAVKKGVIAGQGLGGR